MNRNKIALGFLIIALLTSIVLLIRNNILQTDERLLINLIAISIFCVVFAMISFAGVFRSRSK
jgi:hypothetical protein